MTPKEEVQRVKRGEIIPIIRLHQLRDELRFALDAKKWKTVRNRARSITALASLAMDPSTCGTGTPHVDGVYSVGTQEFAGAPDKTKQALTEMNALLGKYKEKMRKKKRKKRKG